MANDNILGSITSAPGMLPSDMKQGHKKMGSAGILTHVPNQLGDESVNAKLQSQAEENNRLDAKRKASMQPASPLGGPRPGKGMSNGQTQGIP